MQDSVHGMFPLCLKNVTYTHRYEYMYVHKIICHGFATLKNLNLCYIWNSFPYCTVFPPSFEILSLPFTKFSHSLVLIMFSSAHLLRENCPRLSPVALSTFPDTLARTHGFSLLGRKVNMVFHIEETSIFPIRVNLPQGLQVLPVP